LRIVNFSFICSLPFSEQLSIERQYVVTLFFILLPAMFGL